MIYVFPDTNIFIHFVDFEQVDWKTVCSTSCEVMLVISPMVLAELDNHKYNKNGKIAKRVKKLLPKIEALALNATEGKYKLTCLTNRPLEITFTSNKLHHQDQDDNTIASIIEFKQTLDSNDSIFYVSNDTGARLKARTLGVTAIQPPDEYLLPNEPDENESKIQALQKELHGLKNALPDVLVAFSNNTTICRYKKLGRDMSKDIFIKEVLKDIKLKNPYLQKGTEEITVEPALQQRLINLAAFALTSEQVDEYNEKLDQYFIEYAEFAGSLFELEFFKEHSLEINLVINNEGTAPAHDIDIELHFPDGFELMNEDELPRVKAIPQIPRKPKNRFDLNMDTSVFAKALSITNPLLNPNFSQHLKSTAPVIQKTNSYHVSYHRDHLKHNQQLKLETLFAKFTDIRLAKGFEIDYNLKISNIPKIVTGKLHIAFED